MMFLLQLLGALAIASMITSCSTYSEPEPPIQLCDVRAYQPYAVGSYWIYETSVQPGGRITIDSMVVTDTSSTGTATSFTLRYFVDGSLVNEFTSGFAKYGSPNEYLVEQLPSRFNDLRTPTTLREWGFQGPVLYCGMSLGPVSIYAQLDSISVVDTLGNMIRAGLQYHIVSDGSHTTATMSQLSISSPTPTIDGSTGIRRVDMTTADTVMIQEPSYATFPNGKRYYTSSTRMNRTYAYGVGMLLESITQEIGVPTSTTPTMKGSTRRLLRYGRVK
ncbi:MAG: hypothetical protein JSS89_09225 [Bacteroidetes bacterium]|nr:hypothetical protein [Bacteroidota bacterium]